ncbi:dehydrogenase [Serratia quinivorans]|uniref:dehydrogenase n=1 Tax=Serratia quinivorans TaxID=137545 RepID=UPI003F98FE25
MNTQNVNVKTAAQEPSERWGKTPVLMFSGKYPDADRVMSRQLEFMDELHGASVSPDELEQALYEIFKTMTDRVAFDGVAYFNPDKPKIVYEVAKYWVKAQRLAGEYFGTIGNAAWEHARYRLAITLAIDNSYV